MCVTKWTENVIAGEVFWIGKGKGTNWAFFFHKMFFISKKLNFYF
jgi:hypothetical protein